MLNVFIASCIYYIYSTYITVVHVANFFFGCRAYARPCDVTNPLTCSNAAAAVVRTIAPRTPRAPTWRWRRGQCSCCAGNIDLCGRALNRKITSYSLTVARWPTFKGKPVKSQKLSVNSIKIVPQCLDAFTHSLRDIVGRERVKAVFPVA